MHRTPFRLCVVTLALALPLFALAAARARAVNQIIYDDALENAWVNYSWATVNFSNTTPVHAGADSISVNAGAYQALYLHNSGIAAGEFTSLSFWINGGASGGQGLQVQATINGNAQAAVPLAAPAANTWQQVTIPLAQLGVASAAGFDGFWIQSTSGTPEPVFYVDDISLIGTPAPNPVLLSVNAGSVVRAVDGRIFGVNTAIWDSELDTAASATLLGATGTNVMRFPGGSAADEYAWQTDRGVPPDDASFTWDSSFSQFAALASTLGAQAYLTVNYGSGTPQQAAAWVAYANGSPTNMASLGTDSQGTNWQTVAYWASLRAAAPLATDDGYNFLRVSHPAPYGFKYWEIGNECYGSWERDDHGTAGSGLTGAPQDPLTYAQYFVTFAQQMKAVDPTVKIGAVAINGEDSYGNGRNGVANPFEGNSIHSGWTPVMLHTLLSLGVTPDFLIFHDYPQDPGEENDATLLQAGSDIPGYAANLRGMINDYFGQGAGAGIELAMTELNSVSYNPGKQTTSLVNGLYLADALGSLSQTEFNDCDWWDLRNGSESGNNNSSSLYGWRPFGDYGILASGDRSDTPLNTPYPAYYAGKLLTHWAGNGDSVLSASSNYSLLSAYAARRVDGSLTLLVINKSPDSDLTGQITLGGFTPSSGTATWYGYGKSEDLAGGDLSSGTINNVSGAFSYTFTSYSMTVIVLPPPASIAPPPAALPFPANGIVYLQAAANGLYVSAGSMGTGPNAIANVVNTGAAQQFQLVDLGGGNVGIMNVLSGEYLTSDSAGANPLTLVSIATPGLGQQFRLVAAPNGYVSIYSMASGNYVSADLTLGGELIANRTTPLGWESFLLQYRTSVVPAGFLCALRSTVNGNFVTSGNGSSPLIAGSPLETNTEMLQFVDLGNGYCNLRTAATGLYVSADDAGTGPLIANRPAAAGWEEFRLIDVGNGNIALQAVTGGAYVTVGTNNLIANSQTIGSSQQFALIMSFRALANGKIVTADNQGASPLIANRAAIGGWEQFQMRNAGGGLVALLAQANQMYVTADPDGVNPLIANRIVARGWEWFLFVPVGNGLTAIQAAANGEFVSASNAGMGPLINNRAVAEGWEWFY